MVYLRKDAIDGVSSRNDVELKTAPSHNASWIGVRVTGTTLVTSGFTLRDAVSVNCGQRFPADRMNDQDAKQ